MESKLAFAAPRPFRTPAKMAAETTFLFTSESVNEGHPGRVIGVAIGTRRYRWGAAWGVHLGWVGGEEALLVGDFVVMRSREPVEFRCVGPLSVPP